MLATTFSLHDIDDVEGFVAKTIERSGIELGEAEKEDLMAEGIGIVFELSKTFEPQRAGYAQPGRFSGYAAQFLPRRLGDTWHSRHPEHSRTVVEGGKRSWVYRPTPLSLDAYLHPLNGKRSHGAETSIRPPSQVAPVPVASAMRG